MFAQKLLLSTSQFSSLSTFFTSIINWMPRVTNVVARWWTKGCIFLICGKSRKSQAKLLNSQPQYYSEMIKKIYVFSNFQTLHLNVFSEIFVMIADISAGVASPTGETLLSNSLEHLTSVINTLNLVRQIQIQIQIQI